MSTFNNNRFTPGNKANMKSLIAKQYIQQYYGAFNTSQITDNINNADDMTMGSICNCLPFNANENKQGFNDPTQTENRRIAQILTGTLGGRITFGNFYKPVKINYIGGWEGQPGGTARILRNSF